MTRVVADITMSLDGFVTGPDPDLEHGLGRGGEDLHTWAFSEDPVDAEEVRRATERSGAVVMGRRLFDIIDGPGGWNDEVGYGAREVASPPFFVVTHAPPSSHRLGLDFTFVTEGVAEAVRRARDVAGDKEVVIMGGGEVIAQALDAGLVEELHLHLAPLLLGAGTPLFAGGRRIALRQMDVQVSSNATHLTYAVG